MMNIVDTTFVPSREYQSQLGQFMTPDTIATFMASWLKASTDTQMRVLDAGAGKGSLSRALGQVWAGQGVSLKNTHLTLYEMDEVLCSTLSVGMSDIGFGNVTLHASDYILESALLRKTPHYTHAILNPPYKKISSKSHHRAALRSCGIETGNLYSGFVALALQQLREGGQLVAIIPRSFCNGPYFKPFRKMLLSEASLTHIHLFESRKDAFQADGVLQENIIIRLVKGGDQGAVSVSTSLQADFKEIKSYNFDFEKIVYPEDDDQFIHIPAETTQEPQGGQTKDRRISLGELEVQLSTGPVVGFRLKEHLRSELCNASAPLIYPVHLRDGRVRWPLSDHQKANAIMVGDETRKWLYPNGCYCVVRRFSSKEERHRVVASVVESEDFPGAELLGLDNKLNVFHAQKNGLPRTLVYGLAAYLNTDIVDEEFRLFSGHTQVNATDLRRMKYPRRDLLIQLGHKLLAGEKPSQETIYSILEI